ncbi:MAG: STAS domain-containing protein [Actinomycetota bacterium]
MESLGPTVSTSDYFSVDVRRFERSATLFLKGELDLGSAEVLSDALTAVEIFGADPVVVDMSLVGFLDCSGLSVLLGAYNRACRDDRNLLITNPQATVRRIFALTGCNHLLNGSARQDPGGLKAPA